MKENLEQPHALPCVETYASPSCEVPAERSGVAQPCPPSANGCPEARADGQTGADSSVRCPEVNGPRCPIASAVALQVLNRAETGFKKYGVNAARTDLSTLQWVQHLQEELLDAAVYLERLKSELGIADAGQCNGQRVLPGNDGLCGAAAPETDDNTNSRTRQRSQK